MKAAARPACVHRNASSSDDVDDPGAGLPDAGDTMTDARTSVSQMKYLRQEMKIAAQASFASDCCRKTTSQ